MRALHRAAHTGQKPKDGSVSALARAAREGDGIPETLFTAEELVTGSIMEPISEGGIKNAVFAELENGYDMLFLGIDHGKGNVTVTDGGVAALALGAEVEGIVRDCPPPVAIALARTPSSQDRANEDVLNILLPITGADYSLAGAEVAVAIAKGSGARLTALHVSQPPTESDLLRRPQEVRKAARGVARDLEALGRREGVDIALRLRVRASQEATIIREVDRGGYNLVVLGVKVRAGERISFGQSVAVLLEHIPCSVLLIAF